MASKIRIFGTVATINNYKWTSSDKTLEDMLNSFLPYDGPKGSDPNPDDTAARQMVELFDAELLETEDTEDGDVIL